MTNISSEKYEVLLKILKAQLPQLIPTNMDLIELLYFSSEEHCYVLLQALQAQLSVLIKTKVELMFLLNILSDEQCKFVLRVLKDQVPELIESEEDLAVINQSLSTSKNTICSGPSFKKMFDKGSKLPFFANLNLNIFKSNSESLVKQEEFSL